MPQSKKSQRGDEQTGSKEPQGRSAAVQPEDSVEGSVEQETQPDAEQPAQEDGVKFYSEEKTDAAADVPD
ncbi:MAG TPA: hypothetical protein DG761_07645, partial [Gammaproteobacteria bacterium]|nr:hypothetical protein [Gammaproteobacteria bacterium]